MHQTIIDLLKTADQDALALGGIGRPASTFRELIAQAEATVAALNSRGIGRNDRVAIVLPNGPEMASASVLGILIFSGSLYSLVLTDIGVLGAITPIGGLALMAGWAGCAWWWPTSRRAAATAWRSTR